jgi:2-dehydropantoate 2-reductase
MLAAMSEPRIVVAGAGSIGCYVGGLLAAAGRVVTLLCRERVAADIRGHGLHLTSLDGLDLAVGAGDLALVIDSAALAGADIVLVTVKSGATREMARLIAVHAPAHAKIVSLQNGIGNAAGLRRELSDQPVLAGMVPFNVLRAGLGHYHRGTSGALVIEAGHPEVTRALSVPHLPVATAPDMAAVLWGKLLLNLNNALNALSGLTLHDQLQQRSWRKLLAIQQREALAVLGIVGIRPWSMGPLPARLLPWVLRLPTPLFRLLSRSAVRIDRRARSSMWEDLERRRPTEIAELQGAVVRLAERLGREAPANATVRDLVRAAEQAAAGSPRLDARPILGNLRQAPLR